MSSKPHHEAELEAIRKVTDDGTKWTFHPRGFSIIWGNDRRYWILPEKGSYPGANPAELVQVCWLELTGSTWAAVPRGTYSIQFNISMKQGAFGWNNCPVFMMAKVGKKGRYTYKKTYLSPGTETTPVKLEIEVKDGADDKLYFGLYEVWTGKWKGGLLIYGAEVAKVA